MRSFPVSPRFPRRSCSSSSSSKKGLEVALAEGLAAAAADDLEEESGAVLQGLGEELQQVALIIGIDEDAQVADAAGGLPSRRCDRGR